MPITGQVIGKQLCDVLGLDGSKVAGFTMRVYPDEIVIVTCEYAPDIDDIAPVFAQYELVARAAEPE